MSNCSTKEKEVRDKAWLQAGWVLFCLLCLMPTLAHGAWYDTNWKYRKAIVLDGAQISGNLSNFPVVIRLQTDDQLRDYAQTDGDDILFTDANGSTKLNHEIERFNPTTGELVAWVRLPSVNSGADKTIYLYYGNSGVASQENATNVWDSSYQGVWHLDNDYQDSTSQNNDGSSSGTSNSANAVIADGEDINGNPNRINMGSDSSLDNLSAFTFETWIRPDFTTSENDTRIMAKGSATVSYNLRFDEERQRIRFTRSRSMSALDMESTTGSIAWDQWQHIVVVVDINDSTARMYINGQEVSPYNSRTVGFGSLISDSSFDFLLGNRYDDSTGFKGSLDESRMSSNVRSAEWINTSYNNQRESSTFLKTLSTQEAAVSFPLYLLSDGIPLASLSVVSPTAPSLANYDPGRDAEPGLVISRGGLDETEADPLRYQQWVSSTSGISINSNVSLKFWTAIKNFNNSMRGVVDAFLLDCDSGGNNCSLLAQTQKDVTPWSGGASTWVQHTLDFGSVNYTVASGRTLAVKTIVNNASGDDLWFAYDTTSYPTKLDSNIPLVEFSNSAASDTETAGGNKPVLLINGTVTSTQTIDVSITGGNAVGGGTDYTNTATVTIPAGVYDGSLGMAIALNLSIQNDNSVEPDETIQLTLTNPSANIGISDANGDNATTNMHTYTILDDDAALVEFALATSGDSEASGGNIPVLLINGNVITAQSITVNVTGGDALTPDDYSSTAVVTIPINSYDGTLATAIPINLSVVNDTLIENSETIDFVLATPSTGILIGDADSSTSTQSTHTYTISDNETASVQFVLANSAVAEDVAGGQHNVTVRLNTTVGTTLAAAVSVDVADLLSGNATEGVGNDYTYTSPTNVQFDIGDTNDATRDITLTILNDAAAELDELVNLQLQNIAGAATIFAADHQVSILDDETTSVEFALSSSTIAEDLPGSIHTIDVRLNVAGGGTLGANTSVDVVDLLSGNASAAGVDYTFASPETVDFFIGDADGLTKQISISINNENIIEGPESVNLQLQNPVGPATIANANHSFDINNDDLAPIEFQLASSSDTESIGGNIPLLIINGTLDIDRSIDVNVTGGNADPAGVDFSNILSVNIPAGTYDGTAVTAVPINLTISDELLIEGDETIDFSLTNPAAGLVIWDVDGDFNVQDTHTYTINDDETATVQFLSATSSVLENVVGETHTVTIELVTSVGATLASAVSVDVADLLTGSALPAGTDYIFASPAPLLFSAGSGNGTPRTTTILINNDDLVEGDETVQLVLQNPLGPATVGAQASHEVTITTDEQASDLQVTLAVDNSTPSEGDTVIFTVTVNNIGPNPVTNFSLDDVLPAGLSPVSVTPSVGSWLTPTWSIGLLGVGASATLSYETTVDVGTGGLLITNTVSNITLDQQDTNVSVDDTSEVITINNSADLEITKIVDNATPTEGDTINYTITVTNNGPAQAKNINIADNLPLGVSYVSSVASQGAYLPPNWSVGTLDNGASATLSIQVLVEVATAGTAITNYIGVVTLDQNDSNITVDDLNQAITIGPDIEAPDAISTLTNASQLDTSVTLTWSAVGDNGLLGTASSYDVRYSSSPITPANWASATPVTGEPVPSATGSLESFTVTGLTSDTTYYFAVVASDEVPNAGNLSNVVLVSTLGLAATSVAAEISPNQLAAGNRSTLVFQALPNIDLIAGNSGVDRVSLNIPAGFTNSAVDSVLVAGIPVAYTTTLTPTQIQVDLASKVTTNVPIEITFSTDPPATASVASFTAIVDDSSTVSVSAQTVSEGNANGDGGDLNSLSVTVEGLAASSTVAEVVPGNVSIGVQDQSLSFFILPTINTAGGDTGIDTISISLPNTASDIQLQAVVIGNTTYTASAGCPGSIGITEYCAVLSGQDLILTLGTAVTTDQTTIRVDMSVDVANSIGSDPIIITVDDSTTVTQPQVVLTGDADGNPVNSNALNFSVESLVDPNNSSVEVTPQIILADGLSLGTVSIVLRDTDNNPKAGKTVELSSSRNTTDATGAKQNINARFSIQAIIDNLTQPLAVTDSTGLATGAVSSSTPGVSSIIARETGDNITVTAQPLVFFTQGQVIDITKVANKKLAVVGDIVTYAIEIRNTSVEDAVFTRMMDVLPPNFKYVRGTARLNRASIPDPVGNRTLTFDMGTIPGLADSNNNGRADQGEPGYMVLNYQLLVGSGAKPGDYTNRAYVTDVCDECIISNSSEAEIEVDLDPLYDLGTVIGKVFEDENKNHIQDDGEKGLAGVELILDNGIRVTTDEYGRYHLPAVKPVQRAIKIVLRSISDFARTTTEEVQILSVTPGLLVKANFGVSYGYDEETIGRDPTYGLNIISKQQNDPIQMQGNVNSLSVLVNGKEVILDTADVQFVTRKLDDVVVIQGDKLDRSIQFNPKLKNTAGLKTWRLDISSEEKAGIRTLSGTGPLPEHISWDGLSTTGEMIKPNVVYHYQLTVEYENGTTSSSPRRLFGVNKQTIVSLNLSGGAFKTGSTNLTDEAKTVLKEAAVKMRQYPDETIFVDGHSDSTGDDKTNMVLSENRAKAAVDYLVQTEELPQERFTIRSFGSSRPIASNDDEVGRELNRRIELTGTVSNTTQVEMAEGGYQRPYVEINSNRLSADPYGRFVYPLQENEDKALDIKLTSPYGESVDTRLQVPQLEIRQPSGSVVLPYGSNTDVYSIAETSAHESTEANREDLARIIVTGFTDTGNQVELEGTRVDVNDQGEFSLPLDVAKGLHSYELLITNKQGFARIFHLQVEVFDKDKNGNLIIAIAPVPGLTVYLPAENQVLTASEITVSGFTEQDNQVFVNGQAVEIAVGGRFSTKLQLPEGISEINVKVIDKSGYMGEIKRSVEVSDESLFLFAFADGEVGQLSHKGYLEGAGASKSKEYYSDGRVSYYLKGTIAGKYLITSAYDSGDEEDHMFSGLSDSEQEGLLSNIDPDKIYPVYGDNSTLEYDVPRSGKFYLALEGEELQALVGNFKTDHIETDLTAYRRHFYGAKVVYRSSAKTSFDKPFTEVSAHGAEIRQIQIVDELRATGGSLYYLSHDEVISGSEQVTVVVKDQDTGLILSRTNMALNFDYTINYDQGRLMLKYPLSSVDGSNQLVSGDILSGNPVFVIVRYEAKSEGFKKTAGGVRLRQHITDNTAIGGTLIQDELDIGAYTLQGVDAEYRLGKNSWFRTELAGTTGAGNYTYTSDDGGLSYNTLRLDEQQEGSAWRAAFNIDVSEIFDGFSGLQVSAYIKETDSGFHSSDNILDSGSRHTGLGLNYSLSDADQIFLSYEKEEDADDTRNLERGDQENTISSLQWKHTNESWDITTEVLNRETLLNEQSSTENYAAAQYGQKLTENLKSRLRHQQSLSGEKNNQSTVGLDYNLNANFDIGMAYTDGTRGDSAQAMANYHIGDNKVYLTERVQENDARYASSSVVGAESKLGTSSTVYTEYQLMNQAHNDTGSSVLGARNKFLPADGLVFKLYGEYGGRKAEAGDKYRYTLGSTLAFSGITGLTLSTKGEYRKEWGATNLTQLLNSNKLELKLSPDYTALAKYRYSRSLDLDNKQTLAKFKEQSIGLAYRPTEFDWFNAITRYTILDELRPDLSAPLTATRTNMNIASIEWSLDMGKYLEWVEKQALKQRRETQFLYPSIRTHTRLAIHRLNVKIYRNIDIGLEFRSLSQKEADDRREGWLTEISWRVAKNVKLGSGYNFTDFSDNEFSDNNYSSRGTFLRIQATY